jgi:sugar phosphate isomerase/epimerase
MRIPGRAERHLTYCSNIHPGESWEEVRENLVRYVVPVRERVAPGVPFGLGLRLSGRAARTLAEPEPRAELRELLRAHDLYLFTLNGFPYGTFHGTPVKEEVYRPDWLEPERLRYTNGLADLLAELLPEGMEGTISTVPGAFAPRVRGEQDAARMAAALARHAAQLVRVRQRTGRSVALALEPEPCCHLETVAQAVEFFERHLFGPAAVEALAREAGLERAEAEAVLREHLGVCFDACHMAVEYEDPADALAALDRAGIRVPKVQVSAGLRVELAPGDASVVPALRAFAEDVYLHQVVERSDGALRRWLDLPEALRRVGEVPGYPREWRVHFHVPLFRERLGRFESTQGYVRELLALLAGRTDCGHLEVETYTWDVLPAEFRDEGIVPAVARELEWTLGALRGG